MKASLDRIDTALPAHQALRAQEPHGRASPLYVAEILRLQRMAGNAAVGSLLSRPAATVQRCPGSAVVDDQCLECGRQHTQLQRADAAGGSTPANREAAPPPGAQSPWNLLSAEDRAGLKPALAAGEFEGQAAFFGTEEEKRDPAEVGARQRFNGLSANHREFLVEYYTRLRDDGLWPFVIQFVGISGDQILLQADPDMVLATMETRGYCRDTWFGKLAHAHAEWSYRQMDGETGLHITLEPDGFIHAHFDIYPPDVWGICHLPLDARHLADMFARSCCAGDPECVRSHLCEQGIKIPGHECPATPSVAFDQKCYESVPGLTRSGRN